MPTQGPVQPPRVCKQVCDSDCDSGADVLIAIFADLEQAAAGSDVALLQLIRARHDGGAAHTGDTVVVRLAHTADGGDVRLQQVVLGKVCRVRYTVQVKPMHMKKEAGERWSWRKQEGKGKKARGESKGKQSAREKEERREGWR